MNTEHCRQQNKNGVLGVLEAPSTFNNIKHIGEMMPKLTIIRNFVYDGRFFRSTDDPADSILEVSEDLIREEMELGLHPKTKRPLSALLNHSEPIDKEAKEILGDFGKKNTKPAPKKTITAGSKSKKIRRIRRKPKTEVKSEKPSINEKRDKMIARFDEIGKAYDKRWSDKRLSMELTKAEKETGV